MVGSLSGSSLINSGTFAGSDGGFQYQGAPSAPSTSGLSDYPFWPDVSGSQQSFGQAVKGGTIFDGGAAGVGASLGGGGVSFGGERDSFGGGGANFGGDGAGFGGGEFGGGFKFSGGFGSGGGIDRYPREPLLRGNGDELGPIPGVKNAGGAGGVDGGMVFAGQDGGTTAGGSTSFGGQDVGSLMIERNFGPGGFAGDLSGNGAGLFDVGGARTLGGLDGGSADFGGSGSGTTFFGGNSGTGVNRPDFTGGGGLNTIANMNVDFPGETNDRFKGSGLGEAGKGGGFGGVGGVSGGYEVSGSSTRGGAGGKFGGSGFSGFGIGGGLSQSALARLRKTY